MLGSRKSGALLLAGVAAYAYYKYCKMTPEARKKLTGNLKEGGKSFIDSIAPAIKNEFTRFTSR